MAGEDVAALLDRSASGDQSAFKRLYDAQSPRLYALALRLLNQPDLAADAVHDTFLLVWQRTERFEPVHGHAEAWLTGLLRYRALDVLRRGGNRPAQHPDDGALAQLGDASRIAPDQEASSPAGRFAALDPSVFLSLRLAFLDGLTHAELAERLQKPLGVVKTGMRRALIGLEAMSASMTGFEDAEERMILAADYVLGTLPPDERARLKREMEADPVLRGEIAFWEETLGVLAAEITPMTPPIALWSRIERSVHAPGVRAPAMPVRSNRTEMSAAFWKAITAVSFLLAAGVAFTVLMDRTPMAVPMTALSKPGAPEPAFVVETRSDGVVQVMPLHPGNIPSDRDMELWSLPADATVPQPLGILPPTGRHLHSAMLPLGNSKLLVTLEPRGGSPTGRPTGPVLFSGPLSLPD